MTGVRWSEADLAAHKQRMAGIGLGRIGLDADAVRGDTHLAPAATTPAAAPHARKHPEQDLQKAVIELLDAALPLDWRAVHVPNGGWRSKIEAGILKAMGVRPGFPDLALIGRDRIRDRLVVIELKAKGKGGRLSEAQEEWRDWFLRLGIPWFLCRSIEDVIAACEDAGVPLRVAA